MNWGNISEIIGTVAVVVSVIYLAFQVRKQTEEARLAATRELSAQFQDTLRLYIEDEKFNEIYRNGIADYEALEEGDRLRFSMALVSSFRVLEQQYLHISRGNVDADYFRSMDLGYGEILKFPGIQRWWDFTKHSFEEGFRAHIDKRIREADLSTHPSTFRKS